MYAYCICTASSYLVYLLCIVCMHSYCIFQWSAHAHTSHQCWLFKDGPPWRSIRAAYGLQVHGMQGGVDPRAIYLRWHRNNPHFAACEPLPGWLVLVAHQQQLVDNHFPLV